MTSIQPINQTRQAHKGFFYHNNQIIEFKKITKNKNITTIEDCTGLLLWPINHPITEASK